MNSIIEIKNYIAQVLQNDIKTGNVYNNVFNTILNYIENNSGSGNNSYTDVDDMEFNLLFDEFEMLTFSIPSNLQGVQTSVVNPNNSDEFYEEVLFNGNGSYLFGDGTSLEPTKITTFRCSNGSNSKENSYYSSTQRLYQEIDGSQMDFYIYPTSAGFDGSNPTDGVSSMFTILPLGKQEFYEDTVTNNFTTVNQNANGVETSLADTLYIEQAKYGLEDFGSFKSFFARVDYDNLGNPINSQISANKNDVRLVHNYQSFSDSYMQSIVVGENDNSIKMASKNQSTNEGTLHEITTTYYSGGYSDAFVSGNTTSVIADNLGTYFYATNVLTWAYAGIGALLDRGDGVPGIMIENLPIFADNAAAIAGGLDTNIVYKTADGTLKIVY